MDALIHELEYPADWGPKKSFDEKNVRNWIEHNFTYSKIFKVYFEMIIKYLNENNYFKD